MLQEISKYWLKQSTYDTAVGIYATFPLIMVPALLVVNAPYGRFAGKLGIDWSMNGRWSWCIMEIVSPITFALSLYYTKPSWTPFQLILTAAWITHYINRSVIYPARASSMAPIHVFTSLSSVVFNLINGYTNGMWIGRHSQSIDRIQFWVGFGLWAFGFASNIYHDTLLFRLRQKKEKQKRYFIPTGGLFEYVSCPNYLSEIIEWTGYALAASSSIPAIIFVSSTAANLIPRACKTHEWYKKEFENYPNRKAVIPFVF
ncbi:hypothetical protein RMATCC62417_10408 [Rhizopus microsporus]|nr:hypothetical protein RMATCC62417_10408 [Rhizopus microsporus]